MVKFFWDIPPVFFGTEGGQPGNPGYQGLGPGNNGDVDCYRGLGPGNSCYLALAKKNMYDT